MTQRTLINIDPTKQSQSLRYCSFAVNLDRCTRSCNTLTDLPNKVCVRNKIDDLNQGVFNKIMGINESKTFRKHISCECECKFNGRKYNSD